MDCMEFATQFLVQTVPATVFHWQHCILADVRTGMHWRMRRHCFPNCKMPHSSYTLAEFNCYGKCGSETVEILTGLAFKGDVVTTGQTAQSMCFATSLSTAKKILDTGLIPVELFTNSQVNNWFCPRSALLRSLQIYWSGLTDTLDVQEQMALIIYNPGLERYLTLVHCSWTEEQLDWHWRKNWSVHWLQQTVLGPLLDYWITSTGCSVEHCGVPHWIWHPTALHCQGTDGATADGTELQQDLWHALQRTGWTLHPHCESAGTDAWRCEHWMCLAAPVHWWGTAKENWKQTGNCSWRNWHCQGRCEDHWTACWIWGGDCDYHWSLRLSIPTWSLRQLFLNTAMLTDALKSWKQVHWWASSATHLHTAPRLIDTVQLITDCVFHWLASMIDHCMHVQVCDTDSLNQCQGEVLRYMHCTHTTAHSNDTVKHTTQLKPGLSTWLKSLTKRLTESTLVWLELLTVSCTGERSRIFSVCLFGQQPRMRRLLTGSRSEPSEFNSLLPESRMRPNTFRGRKFFPACWGFSSLPYNHPTFVCNVVKFIFFFGMFF